VVIRKNGIHRYRRLGKVIHEDLAKDGSEIRSARYLATTFTEKVTILPSITITVIDFPFDNAIHDEHGTRLSMSCTTTAVLFRCAPKLGHHDDDKILPLTLQIQLEYLEFLCKVRQPPSMAAIGCTLITRGVPTT